MTENHVLNLTDVSFSYGADLVLENISLNLANGQIAGLIGPNGSGKTTLLKLIAGLLKTKKGLLKTTESISWYAVGESLYLDLTLIENLELFARLYSEDHSQIESFIEALQVGKLANQRVRHLSHGQSVRASIARTFLKNASLYILDEPFNGLDDESITQVCSIIKKTNEREGDFEDDEFFE